ncbi:Clp protease N-terminal domain-containing protein [Oricola indica]|uniref:Clp protease N-terminal domain-containing protein n=1 Tax=Oricola indica TaxID=2872591 RepID=UPI003CCC3A63
MEKIENPDGTIPGLIHALKIKEIKGPGFADLLRLANDEGLLVAILETAGVPLDALRDALERPERAA